MKTNVTAKLIVICISFLCLSNTSCSSDEDLVVDPIIGSWQQVLESCDGGISFEDADFNEIWVFNADNTYQNFDGEELCDEGNYIISGNKLDIYYIAVGENWDTPNHLSGVFSVEDDKLTYKFENEEEILILKRI